MSHTPGPWLSEEVMGHVTGFNIEDEQGNVLARVAKADGGHAFPSRDNARLIAAAPELLAACKKALYALKGREHDQFLRDVISKAEG